MRLVDTSNDIVTEIYLRSTKQFSTYIFVLVKTLTLTVVLLLEMIDSSLM
jgi:hypothetical protein